MKCPNCGHAMNHHADKVVWGAVESQMETSSQLIEAYSCPHCGTNAGRLIDGE